jgi:PTS system fructose-specific IIC component
MIFLVGAPAKTILESLTTWLDNMQQSGAMALGLLLGVMMALDMGGPINKAAYGFSVALLASNVSGPMAATMAAGMTPPLGIALATALAPNCFTQEERSAGKAAAILGVSFITEGAIPFAAKDPFRVIPCLALGSATAGALAMAFNVHLMVPHGGVFALLIPHAVDRLSMYLVAILVGTLVTAAAFVLLRRMSTHKSLLRNVSDK